MDRTEFKKRMQSLKSYRENNPGKGYWDWKVEQFDEGGELSDKRKYEIESQVYRAFHPRGILPMPKKSFSEQSEDYGRRRKEARRDRTIDDLKSLLKGLNNTIGVAAAGASLFGGGGWSLARLLSGNRNTAIGRVLAPIVLPANSADTASDIVDFVTEPSWSGAAEVGVGLGLGKWRDFGSKARQAAELGSQVLNANNVIESYFEGGETNEGGDSTPMWLQKPYSGPTYDQVLESLKKDDPAAYNRLAEARAREQNPTSEIVRYIDANGNIATAGNAQGLQPVLTPEDLPGIGDAAEVYNIGKDIVEDNYGSALAGLGLLAIPGGIAGKVYRKGRSELNWSPKSWFEEAAGRTDYTQSDIDALASHVPEYHKIEELTKENGTWLKMPDGSTWKGDARSWVQLQSKNGQKLKPEIIASGVRGAPDPEYNGMAWGVRGPLNTYHARHYTDTDNNVLQLVIPKDVPSFQYNAKNRSWFDLPYEGKKVSTNDIVDAQAAQGKDVIYIDNVQDLGSFNIPMDSKYQIFDNKADYTLNRSTLSQNDVIIAPYVPRKSILGNNGNFDFLNPNIYRIAVPIIGRYSIAEEYKNGGEVPPDNSPVHVNPFTKKPLANGAITPVLDLEDASGFTPIGDILSIRDAYVAAKNKDLLGLGLAGLGFIPFVPTVNRKATQDLMDRAIKQSEKSKQVVDDFYTQRNNVYESMIENEDAFRRAARADRQAGTDYIGTYGQAIRDYLRDPSQYNDDLPMMLFDRDLYGTNIKMQVDPSRPGYITVNPRYKDPDELDDAFKRINPGLVRHEMGHQTDLKAGLQYTDRLADPSKFVSDEKLKEMFPKTHSRLKSTVLNKGSEIKSYMNEFREFLMGERKWEPKESVKSFRRKLDEYSKQFPTLRMIFDSYKSKSDFVRDYNAVPLTDTGTKQNLV